IGRDRFLRNVLIAVGNSAEPELLAAAERRLDDASPVVRGAAVWAVRRLDPERASRRHGRRRDRHWRPLHPPRPRPPLSHRPSVGRHVRSRAHQEAAESPSQMNKPPKPQFFGTQAAWRAWLEKNHAKVDEKWVGFHKVASGKKSITHRQALDEALCFGWID